MTLRSGCAAVLFLTAVSASGAVAADDDPALHEIAEQLQTWADSWETLRFRYTAHNQYIWQPGAPPSYGSPQSSVVIFRSDGSHRREDRGGSTVYVYDLENSVSSVENYYFDRDGTGGVSALKIADLRPSRDGFAYTTSELLPISPMWNSTQREWLGSTLKQLSDRPVAFEERDGVRCARVTLDGCVLFLDSTHGWLPRRCEPIADTYGAVWVVEDFVQMSNGRWFPQSGTTRLPDTPDKLIRHWKVVELEVDKTFPASLFEPAEPGPTTTLRDETTRRHVSIMRRLIPSPLGIARLSSALAVVVLLFGAFLLHRLRTAA